MTICDMAKEWFSSHAMSTDHQPREESLGFPWGNIIKRREEGLVLAALECTLQMADVTEFTVFLAYHDVKPEFMDALFSSRESCPCI